MNLYIYNYIRKNNRNIDNAQRILNNYINKYFNKSINYTTCISNLNLLLKFLENYSFIYNIDLLIELLDTNGILLNNVEFIVNKYYNKIIEGKLEQIINNDFVISIIEAYCISRNIEIAESDYIYDENISNQSDNLVIYLNEISKIPLLSLEEERNIAYKVLKKDENARNKLIESNLRLVISIAKNYTNRGLSFLDLIEEGNLGLIEATEKYDVTLGYKFSTYAIWWIKQKITRAIANNGRNIRMPAHLYEKINAFKRTENELEIKLNRSPKLQEIAEEMNLSIEKTEELALLKNDTISLNTIVGEKQDTELEEYIASEEESVEESALSTTIKTEVDELLKKCNLTDREIEVLKLRFGFDGKEPVTLEEIGKNYKVTRERIRQIEAKALKKIRKSPYIKDLADYMNNAKKAIDNIDLYRKNYYKDKNKIKSYLK